MTKPVSVTGFDWRYAVSFVSGQSTPRGPRTRHLVAEGGESALCNYRPYWRLRPEHRRWFGAAGEEVPMLESLPGCQACVGKLAKLQGGTK